jgi:capsular polysaccharide transport system permease protein
MTFSLPPPTAAKPGRAFTAPRLRIPLWAIMVALPTAAAAFYYFVLAAPIYVSEARYVVRAPAQATPTGLNAILGGAGLVQSGSDAFAVHEYIMSRNAVADLERDHKLSAMLSPPGADFLSRFPRPFEKNNSENLYRAYRRFVSVGYDATTGISTLQVKAFRPQDARVLAEALLGRGEAVVNTLNRQAERDAINQTQAEVLDAQGRVAQAQAALTSFRNRERIIDPARSSAAGLELTTRLSTELATLRAERAGLAAAAPQSPQLPGLDDRIAAYEREISRQQSRVAGETNSLAPKIAEYERLTLERDFMGRVLTSAVSSLETARIEARRKRLYLQRIVNPVAADAPILPRRTRSVLVIFVSLLLAYGAVRLVAAGLREHQQAV